MKRVSRGITKSDDHGVALFSVRSLGPKHLPKGENLYARCVDKVDALCSCSPPGKNMAEWREGNVNTCHFPVPPYARPNPNKICLSNATKVKITQRTNERGYIDLGDRRHSAKHTQ
ncbi:hypothetical protein PoB_007555300 [Plakobranchus ocellatus]|uniref:Uncharacterized protein n=1 Tax=Plakobranchus ocellatus TaxID=259542 RepID=A0AAV4DXF4_9GAST|nr:hypothetical protein PoB_007555300 [Plakobranchus ocellatus]